MAKGIDASAGRPIGNTTRFLSTDELAACWFEVEVEGFGPLTLNWRWFEPNGAIYRENSWVELVPRSGIYRFWDVIRIRNTPVEVKLGKWRVEVYIRTEKLFQTSFLVESPATSYSVHVKAVGLDKKYSASLLVDGVKVGTILGGETKEVSFKIGTAHTLSVDEYVQGEIGVRFHCPANSLSVGEESSCVFLYETEYYLKVVSEYGARGEGWYKAGTIAAFSISTPMPGRWGIQYLFKQWVGDFTGNSVTGMILMDGPKEVKALWISDYSQFYLFVAIIIGVVVLTVGTTLVTWRRRRAKPEALGVPTPSFANCPKCGRQVLYVERVKRYYCTQCRKYL